MIHATLKEHDASGTQADWEKLTPEQKIAVLVDIMDQSRFDIEGGYPSQYVIENGKVYHASIDHDGGPDLTVSTIEEFIEAHENRVTDYFETAPA
jgi:hypothetical protein